MDRDLVYQKREMKGREDEFVRVKQQLQAAMNEKEKLVDKLSLIVHETERKKSQRLEEIMARFKTQQ